MTNETVTVQMGGRTVGVQAETRYLGTNSSGGANVERYEFRIGEHTVDGTWDGDARHRPLATLDPTNETHVALWASLLGLVAAQEAGKRRADLAAIQANERKLYGRVLTRE